MASLEAAKELGAAKSYVSLDGPSLSVGSDVSRANTTGNVAPSVLTVFSFSLSLPQRLGTTTGGPANTSTFVPLNDLSPNASALVFRSELEKPEDFDKGQEKSFSQTPSKPTVRQGITRQSNKIGRLFVVSNADIRYWKRSFACWKYAMNALNSVRRLLPNADAVGSVLDALRLIPFLGAIFKVGEYGAELLNLCARYEARHRVDYLNEVKAIFHDLKKSANDESRHKDADIKAINWNDRITVLAKAVKALEEKHGKYDSKSIILGRERKDLTLSSKAHSEELSKLTALLKKLKKAKSEEALGDNQATRTLNRQYFYDIDKYHSRIDAELKSARGKFLGDLKETLALTGKTVFGFATAISSLVTGVMLWPLAGARFFYGVVESGAGEFLQVVAAELAVQSLIILNLLYSPFAAAYYMIRTRKDIKDINGSQSMYCNIMDKHLLESLSLENDEQMKAVVSNISTTLTKKLDIQWLSFVSHISRVVMHVTNVVVASVLVAVAFGGATIPFSWPVVVVVLLIVAYASFKSWRYYRLSNSLETAEKRSYKQFDDLLNIMKGINTQSAGERKENNENMSRQQRYGSINDDGRTAYEEPPLDIDVQIEYELKVRLGKEISGEYVHTKESRATYKMFAAFYKEYKNKDEQTSYLDEYCAKHPGEQINPAILRKHSLVNFFSNKAIEMNSRFAADALIDRLLYGESIINPMVFRVLGEPLKVGRCVDAKVLAFFHSLGIDQNTVDELKMSVTAYGENGRSDNDYYNHLVNGNLRKLLKID